MRATDVNEECLRAIRSNREKVKHKSINGTIFSTAVSARTGLKETEQMGKKLLSV